MIIKVTELEIKSYYIVQVDLEVQIRFIGIQPQDQLQITLKTKPFISVYEECKLRYDEVLPPQINKSLQIG